MNFKKFIPKGSKPCLKILFESILIASTKKALKEEGLWTLFKKLENAVPDITEQYTTLKVDTDYLRTTVRGLHAF